MPDEDDDVITAAKKVLRTYEADAGVDAGGDLGVVEVRDAGPTPLDEHYYTTQDGGVVRVYPNRLDDAGQPLTIPSGVRVPEPKLSTDRVYDPRPEIKPVPIPQGKPEKSSVPMPVLIPDGPIYDESKGPIIYRTAREAPSEHRFVMVDSARRRGGG